MEIDIEFSTFAANRKPQCMSWGQNGFVLFGGHYLIGIYDPGVGELNFLLVKSIHRGNV
jgi:hypothetical protein